MSKFNSMKNTVKYLAVLGCWLALSVPSFGQLFKYQLLKTGSSVCVQAVPQFTDATACYHGGNAVLITPTTVSIESGDITNGLGSWSIATSAEFMGINFFQFGSETLSSNQNFTSGTPVTLFCVSIDQGECATGYIRLMLQIDHNTPVGTDPDLSLYNAGVQHTVTASNANNCSPENGTVFSGLIGTTAISCLDFPVELVSFEATPLKEEIRLDWQSASEINFWGYELERSEDGKSFSKITWLDGQGGNFSKDYQFSDTNVRKGIVYYYRLKMVNQDGSSEFSPIRTAQLSASPLGNLRIAPNPAIRFFTVSFEVENAGTATLELFGEQGQTVLQQHYQTREGTNELMIGTGKFAAGGYLVRLTTPNGVASGKVVIER